MQFTSYTGHRLKRTSGSFWLLALNVAGYGLAFLLAAAFRGADLTSVWGLLIVLAAPAIVLAATIFWPGWLAWFPRRGDPISAEQFHILPLWLMPAAFGFFWVGDFLHGLYGLKWIALGLIPAVPFAAFVWLRCAASVAERIVLAVGLLLIGWIYGYAAIVVADAAFDRGPVARSEAIVADAWVETGRVRRHLIRLERGWEPVRQTVIRVRPREFAAFARTRRACLGVHRGALDLPWYEVKPCPGSAAAVKAGGRAPRP